MFHTLMYKLNWIPFVNSNEFHTFVVNDTWWLVVIVDFLYFVIFLMSEILKEEKEN